MAGNIVLCSWVRHLTLNVPLSTCVVVKLHEILEQESVTQCQS